MAHTGPGSAGTQLGELQNRPRLRTPALGILERVPRGGSSSRLSSGIPETPQTPVLEPLLKLQVIYSEIRGPPFPCHGAPQVGLEQKMGQNAADEGQPWQCHAPPWASVSPYGHDICVTKCPPPSSLTDSDHL